MDAKFTVGNFYFLKEEITSIGKKKEVYGKKDDAVKLLSLSLPAAVVEGKNGLKFPVHISELKY